MADPLLFSRREQSLHGIHIAVYGGIQARAGGLQPGHHLAALVINAENFSHVRFHPAAHRHVHVPQLPGQAAGDPGLYGEIPLRIDADHLDFDGTAVRLQGSQEGLGRGLLHALHFQGFLQHVGIHIKRPGGALQEHILEAHLALRFGRHQNDIRPQPGLQAVQPAAQGEHHDGAAEDRQGQESRQQGQGRGPSGLANQIFPCQRILPHHCLFFSALSSAPVKAHRSAAENRIIIAGCITILQRMVLIWHRPISVPGVRIPRTQRGSALR